MFNGAWRKENFGVVASKSYSVVGHINVHSNTRVGSSEFSY